MISISELCPFLHTDEIIKRVPESFLSQDDVLKCEWFLTAPKYTTFRVNILKYDPKAVVEIIKQEFEKENVSRGGIIPTVNVHTFLRDCILIGYLNDNPIIDESVEREVVVGVHCANAVLRGAHVFAPGVLALQTNTSKGELVKIVADIEGKCRRGYNKRFPGKTFLVGSGIVQMDRNELFKNNATPKGVAIHVCHNISNVPQVNLPKDLGILQNLPSIVCGQAFTSVSGKVLDMCAAPGNKTTHIATLLHDKGEVIALDKTIKKISNIVQLCETLGISNVKCYAADSTKCIGENKETTTEGPPFSAETFSAVLLDPPCSALGQRPSLRNNITASQLKSYVFLQRRLFKSVRKSVRYLSKAPNLSDPAVHALRPGGLLVYSTCTITLEENEEMVSWALTKFPMLNLKKYDCPLGYPGVQNSSLSEENNLLVTRFGAPHLITPDEDTIGFFIACFIKN